MDRRLSDLADASVARGIITPEQRDRMVALADERAHATPRSSSGEVLLWSHEVPKGFNAITVAYGAGSLAIMFALGWFLADRWDVLGPVGVLLVSLVYASVFGMAARIFSREKFPTAHGIALLLVVCTTPLLMWSALRASGIWAHDDAGICLANDASFWDCGSHVVVLAAATCTAVLAVTRWIRFGPLMIPGAIAVAVASSKVAYDVSRGGTASGAPGWAFVFSASVLAALAYEADRRRGRVDYARWLHIAGAVCAAIALVTLFSDERALRVLLLPTAIAAMVASLFLRRVVWLVLGLGALFSDLTWLAGEVFHAAIAFPVILVLVGISVILVTVWVQRAYPRLAAHVRENDGALAHFPGGSALLLAPALLAVLVMPSTRTEAHWKRVMQQADLRHTEIMLRRRTNSATRPAKATIAPAPAADPDSARDSTSFGETSLSKRRTEGLSPPHQDR